MTIWLSALVLDFWSLWLEINGLKLDQIYASIVWTPFTLQILFLKLTWIFHTMNCWGGFLTIPLFLLRSSCFGDANMVALTQLWQEVEFMILTRVWLGIHIWFLTFVSHENSLQVSGLRVMDLMTRSDLNMYNIGCTNAYPGHIWIQVDISSVPLQNTCGLHLPWVFFLMYLEVIIHLECLPIYWLSLCKD